MAENKIYSSMEKDETQHFILMLERLSLPYYLQSILDNRLSPKDQRSIDTFDAINDRLKENIEFFCNIKIVQEVLKRQKINLINYDSVAKLIDSKDSSIVAHEASLYFNQGLEMLKTAQKMSQTSSPLVEYYGYLQCVKGAILLKLNINKDLLFSFHGITQETMPNSIYFDAKIQPLGVFSALLLSFGLLENIEHYFVKNRFIPLTRLLSGRGFPNNIFDPFIGSWWLSTIVRYRPKDWSEILQGNNNSIIIAINQFRRSTIPLAIKHLLNEFVPFPFS